MIVATNGSTDLCNHLRPHGLVGLMEDGVSKKKKQGAWGIDIELGASQTLLREIDRACKRYLFPDC